MKLFYQLQLQVAHTHTSRVCASCGPGKSSKCDWTSRSRCVFKNFNCQQTLPGCHNIPCNVQRVQHLFPVLPHEGAKCVNAKWVRCCCVCLWFGKLFFPCSLSLNLSIDDDNAARRCFELFSLRHVASLLLHTYLPPSLALPTLYLLLAGSQLA